MTDATITVTSFSNDQRHDTAEAETPEAAVTAARVLWDEAFNGLMGQRRRLVFEVEGRPVHVMETRP